MGLEGTKEIRQGKLIEVIRHAKRGTYILGIYNGFQILTESGLLKGTLMRNKDLKFICKNVDLKIENSNSRFTSKYDPSKNLNIPIAHHDGNYIADEKTINEIEENDQVAFRYCDNPNGS